MAGYLHAVGRQLIYILLPSEC